MDMRRLPDDILILLEGRVSASQDEIIEILQQKFTTLANASPALFWMSDTSKGCNWFNQNWLSFRGRTMEQESGNGWAEGVHPDDFQRCLSIYCEHFDRREPFSMEYRLQRHDGEYVWFLDQGTPRYDSAGAFVGYIGSLLDITELRQRNQEVRLAACVFAHAREGIMITDPEGTIIKVNDAFSRITGFGKEVIGCRPNVLKSGRQSDQFYQEMWTSLTHQGHWEGELWNRRASGELYPENLSISAVRDASGETEYYVAVFADISDRIARQNELEYRAQHDPLTGLPNRALLKDRLEQAYHHSRRSGQPFLLACIDLDGFKEVNDRYGHLCGDQLLIKVAEIIRTTFRDEDTLARYGGDEFILVLPDAGEADECLVLIERLQRRLADPIWLDDQRFTLSASIGISFFSPPSGPPPLTLLRQADVAMYRAKREGRNCYRIYQESEDGGALSDATAAEGHGERSNKNSVII